MAVMLADAGAEYITAVLAGVAAMTGPLPADDASRSQGVDVAHLLCRAVEMTAAMTDEHGVDTSDAGEPRHGAREGDPSSAARLVLVVDDEADLRDVIQMSLELRSDWNVLTASSGAAGIATARREQPGAILLDMMMPEMDGPDTLRRLRSDPATAAIPVVFLTAKVQASGGEAPPGSAGLIRKPFDPLTLADQVAHVLGWAE